MITSLHATPLCAPRPAGRSGKRRHRVSLLGSLTLGVALAACPAAVAQDDGDDPADAPRAAAEAGRGAAWAKIEQDVEKNLKEVLRAPGGLDAAARTFITEKAVPQLANEANRGMLDRIRRRVREIFLAGITDDRTFDDASKAIADAALAVVRDTASGCDAISSWPGAMFIEWIGEMLSVVAGIGISVAPGIALAWWMRDESQSFAAIAPVGCFLLFPVVFLSLLENESAFDALSLPVLRSLVTAAAGWCGFYTTSVMLVAAAVVVVATAQAADGRVALVATALVASIVWLVYFRLLGRLAWYCTDRAAAAERVATSGEDAVAPRAERPDDAAPE